MLEVAAEETSVRWRKEDKQRSRRKEGQTGGSETGWGWLKEHSTARIMTGIRKRKETL